jgi:hypothetical protein
MSAKKPPSKRAARSDDKTRDRLTRELGAEYVRETEGGAR